MDERLRKSPATRTVAVLFILQILFGNIWFAYVVIGQEAPGIVYDAMYVVSFLILISVIWFLSVKFGHGLSDEE